MSMTPLIDRIQGHIVAPDGTLIERRAVIINEQAARIIRDYWYWTLQQQLEPLLFCAACSDVSDRATRCEFDITEAHIVIICQCQIRYHQGPWTKPTPIAASIMAPSLTSDYLAMTHLSVEAAQLLRLYKRVLQDLGLKESLHCNACFHLGNVDGCRENRVTDNEIRIVCRCTVRTFSGMTL